MDDAIAFKQLLQIRNIRVDSMTRQLAALRDRRDVLAAELITVERDLRKAAERADAASPSRLLQPGRLIGGEQLSRSLHQTAVARADAAQIDEQRQKLEQEHRLGGERVAKMQAALSSAIRIVQRTECVLEQLKASASITDLEQ